MVACLDKTFLDVNFKNPHVCLNALQIKQHLKYLEWKENKNHENIHIFFLNNEHSFDNVIENISRKHANNISTNILSSNIIDQEIDLQLKKIKKKIFSICGWKKWYLSYKYS